MKNAALAPKRRPLFALALAAALLCLGLLGASSAAAAYQQVGNFAGTPGELHSREEDEKSGKTDWPEEVQLGKLGGMAVNYTGAGGVPAGTVYAATGNELIARYNPDGSFSESWGFEGTLGGAPNRRCGPEGEAGQPTCVRYPEGPKSVVDVDVDQSTGDVYFLNTESLAPGKTRIHVFSPDGSKLLAEFGEGAPPGEKIAESPTKLHGSDSGGLAVNAAGDVYVFDADTAFNHRLMVFQPQSAGDYEHYVYAGQQHDVWAGGPGSTIPLQPVANAAGDLYVTNEESIYELDPSTPSGPPLCEFRYPKRGIETITVNPLGGEVFFYSYKEPGTLHELGSECAGGKWHEASHFRFSPNRTQIGGLAFDPERVYQAGRPAGVLYAGAPGSEGGKNKTEGGATFFESAIGYVFAGPREVAPTVTSESFSHVTTTTAALAAAINPQSFATRYVFQYETEAQYAENQASDRFAGASEAPPGGAVAGEGSEVVAVSASLVALQPGTHYRFRVLAASHCSELQPEKLCEGEGEALSFATFPTEAPGLPDRRAWELVSPAQKSDGQVLPAEPLVNTCPLGYNCKPGALYGRYPEQSAPSGDAIAYEGTAFGSESGPLGENEYIARRTPSGWQSTDLSPTGIDSRSGGFRAFTADLSRGVLAQDNSALSPEAPGEYGDLYLQQSEEPLSLRSLLDQDQAFQRSAGGTERFLIRYAGASADLSRVFFLANDALSEEVPGIAPPAPAVSSTEYNLYEWHEGRLALVNVAPGNATAVSAAATFPGPSAHPVSKDGSRVFFEDASSHQVYVREDGERTRAISTEGTPDPGKLLSASPDGSAVLLANGHLHYPGDEEPTVDLTQGKGGFQGVVGESEDLSRLYFVDTEVLAENEGAGLDSEGNPQLAEAGRDNLYAWASGGGTRFVASLLGTDEQGSGGVNAWESQPANRSAEASPNGRYVAFLSKAPLTVYDNTGPCGGNQGAGEVLPGACFEAFLYDSATGKLSCPSCNPSGERPLGRAWLPRLAQGTHMPQPRYLTDEGRLYFDSQDSLVPADTNLGVEGIGAEDVYEYEPTGVGTCTREAGCVSLISAGTGNADSNFLAMDPSGRNVFFTTRDQLALKDRDDLYDLYDAREGGGIGAETEVARSECQGEACQPPVAPPNDPTPGSSTFEGAGNVHEVTAKKHKKKTHKRHAHAHKRHSARANRNHGGAK
jgi:DNA-binding beta-propeller fold protein YncE